VTRLQLTTDFRSIEMQRAVVPVEVRRPDFALIATGRAPGVIDVPDGKYSVVARLPGGQQLRADIEVPAGAPLIPVVLRPAVGEETKNESMEQVLFMSGQSARTRFLRLERRRRPL
jgi:hypothetical protein